MEHEHQRGSHHPGTPGEDAAVDAAAVAHEEGLEGAEKQYADQIAQEEEGAQQHQGGHAEDTLEVQDADGHVDRQPHRRHRYRDAVRGRGYCRPASRCGITGLQNSGLMQKSLDHVEGFFVAQASNMCYNTVSAMTRRGIYGSE